MEETYNVSYMGRGEGLPCPPQGATPTPPSVHHTEALQTHPFGSLCELHYIDKID